MLVFQRTIREQIVIDGNITVTVLSIRGGQVRLGIEAPQAIAVRRGQARSQIDAPGTIPIRWPQSNDRPPRPAA